jgi:hypothetical protein
MDKTLAKKLAQLEGLYALTERDLTARILSFNTEDLAVLLADVDAIVDNLDQKSAVIVSEVARRILDIETKAAERLARLPEIAYNPEAVRALELRFYKPFYQQNQQIRSNVKAVIERGYSRGLSLADNRAFQKAVVDQGIVGLVRSDGSKLSIKATGKAMVRTRVNEFQNHVALERYKAGGVEEVEFVVGGACRFRPITCTSLNGRRFPVDAIPPEFMPPRHLYGNSRLIPVVAYNG